MAQGIGYKDADGSYGFRLTEDGKIILGNTSDDVIQITGTLDINGNLTVSSNVYDSSICVYQENFEGLSDGSTADPSTNGTWTNGLGSKNGSDIANGYGWVAEDTDSNSSGTGPDNAHNGSIYVFTEASSRNNKYYTLQRSFTAAESSTFTKMSFYYHMYGANMGNLYVYGSTDGASWTQLDITKDASGAPSTANIISGQQHTAEDEDYSRAEVNLKSYSGSALYIRIVGLTGNDYPSDIAIDAIEFIPEGTFIISPTNVSSSIPVTASAFYSDAVTVAGELDATSLDISGNADIDGTLEADAITVNGTALNTVIAGVTVANATLASTVTVTDSTATAEFPLVFNDESNALLDDTGALTYNPAYQRLTVPVGGLVVNGQVTATNIKLTTGTIWGADDSATYVKSDGDLNFVIDEDNDESDRSFNWYDDSPGLGGTKRMALDQTGELEVIGTGFVGDGTNLTNGGQLISQTIIDGSSTTFSCETASSTYKQINDDTTAAKVASITFTVPTSRKVLITMTSAVRDFDSSSQIFRVRITDSNSESTEGSWGSAWNDEQISGHYATDFFNHTFQWYFDGTASPHSWAAGDSKTMYFQIKVDSSSETVSLKAGNNYAPLVISAVTVPTGVSFVDMDS